MTYPDVQLFIAGSWRKAASGDCQPVFNPATDRQIGTVACARDTDLDAALAAADDGFRHWRRVPAIERSKVLRKAAAILRERHEYAAALLTQEQGKPLAEARLEIQSAVEILEWFAEEARRNYGRTIPARLTGVRQIVEQEPIGPVAAFTPWNFPVVQAARKVAAALAAGCSIILKGAEEAPAACAELIRALSDADMPPGVVNLVFGIPARISEYVIPHPVIRKISFTGSTQVGKQLASLAGLHMKPVTMELGGHAPVLVMDDADVEEASLLLATAKFRNAGQVCIAPTRFLIQDAVYERFTRHFLEHVARIRVGDGADPATTMGAMTQARRLRAVRELVEDAADHGAKVLAGGRRIGETGNFLEPTVIAEVPLQARAMSEEPFGPLAIFNRFEHLDDAVKEANRLPYGLAAYAYTRSPERADVIASAIECGMLSVNHHGLSLAETPFGGVKESGHGSEGGTEGIESYLVTKFVTRARV